MKKETKKKGAFSLVDFTNDKVKRLTLHIEDIKVNETKDSDTKVPTAIISGTLYINKDKTIVLKEGEDSFYTINFMLPLQANAEFKRHILSIIKSALDLDKNRIQK